VPAAVGALVSTREVATLILAVSILLGVELA